MDESQIWLTSDTHFGHLRDFIWSPRGFSSVEEHDEEIIKRWNEKVQPNDIVYHLGDVMLNDNEHGIKCLNQLNGRIHIVRGNHDTPARIKLYKECPSVVEVGKYADVIKYKGYNFYLSHYPTLTANFDDKSLKQCVINLCGHLHTKDKFIDMNKGIIYHCEVDAHNCYPITLDEIIEDIKNFQNEIKDINKSLIEYVNN